MPERTDANGKKRFMGRHLALSQAPCMMGRV
jgi:hypothetical protein